MPHKRLLFTNPFHWKRDYNTHVLPPEGMLFVWGANMNNWLFSGKKEGDSLAGGGMASIRGPTNGLCRPFYIGVPTTILGTHGCYDCVLTAIDLAFDHMKQQLKDGTCHTIVFPKEKTTPSKTSLGLGFARQQNGPEAQKEIQDALHRAILDLEKYVKEFR